MPKQDIAVELFYGGGWHDLVKNDDVFADTPIVIQRGDGDESAALRPASVTLRLANDDDMYRTSNPLSPLYGKAGVNTPLRVSVGGTVRGSVQASSWTVGQTADFRARPRRGRAWVDVQGGGLLQQVNQWSENLQSPFRQYNEQFQTGVLVDGIGYWPLEQARGSTALESSTPGVSGAVFTDMAPDSQYRPPSSAPLMDFGTNGEIGANFVPVGGATSTTGWQLSWVGRYPTFAAGDNNIMDWATFSSAQWSVVLNPTTGKIGAVGAAGGTTLMDSSTSYGTYDWSQWTLFSVDGQYSAGTTTVWLNWTNADGSKSGFAFASFTGAPGGLAWWDANVFEGVPVGSTIGHVLGVSASSLLGPDLFGTDRKSAWFGYAGETAGNRFARLCDQFNLPYLDFGVPNASTPMGPQGVDTLANQFKEIAATDDGQIFDATTDLKLNLRLRNQRINQQTMLRLNVNRNPSGLPSLPAEVTDDLPIHNVVTASQRDGGQAVATDSTSPMGTQAPPNGRGEYKQTVNVNTADPDNDLPQQANWWLRRGTVNLPRFPQVTVNLAALDADTITDVEQVDVGSVIEIVGYREYTIRLYVIGYTETIGTHSRTITFTCAPTQQFDLGTLNAERLSAASTTVGPLGVTDTTVVLTMTNAYEVWRTGASSAHILAAGEEIALGTVGAVTGTGPWTQTVTGCRRAVNGIAKTHTAGEPVTVLDAIRLGL